MQKRNAATAGALPWRLIDEFVPSRPAARQRGIEIRYPVADVMDTRPPFSEKFGHGTVAVERLQQLDVDIAESQTDDVRAIGGFGTPWGKAQDVAVKRKGLRDAGYGDTDVRD